MDISYQLEPELSADEFFEILFKSAMVEDRSKKDEKRLIQMIKNADIVLTARDNKKLVGISRAITDFSYCCYLSELAVHKDYQKQGIGKELVEFTHETAGKNTNLIIASRPAASNYYAKIGMQPLENGWIIEKNGLSD